MPEPPPPPPPVPVPVVNEPWLKVAGEMTTNQVMALLGFPRHHKTSAEGHKQWLYGARMKRHVLLIEFNTSDKVEGFAHGVPGRRGRRLRVLALPAMSRTWITRRGSASSVGNEPRHDGGDERFDVGEGGSKVGKLIGAQYTLNGKMIQQTTRTIARVCANGATSCVAELTGISPARFAALTNKTTAAARPIAAARRKCRRRGFRSE